MADITKCSNTECPLRYACRRNLAENGINQSWAKFEFKEDPVLDEIECDNFLEVQTSNPLPK